MPGRLPIVPSRLPDVSGMTEPQARDLHRNADRGLCRPRSEATDKQHLSMTPMELEMTGNEKPDFSEALAVGRKLNLKLPDSSAVKDTHAHARAESPPW